MSSHVALQGSVAASSGDGGDAPPMGASGAFHAAGLTPNTSATAGTTKYLREDASWQVPPATPAPANFVGVGGGHAAGLVPDPGASGDGSRFLSESGSFVEPDDATKLTIDNNLSDLDDAATARTNLGLGSLAEQDTSYVLNLIAGLRWKAAVRLATTANGTLATAFANGQTIDAVALVTGNRLLVKDQTAPEENGIYTVNASGAPTRATDADAGAELVNAAVFAEEGTANHDRAFVCTTNATITLGTTGLTWTSFASALGAATIAYVDAADNALATSIGNAAAKSANLSDLASAATARANLGLGPLTVLIDSHTMNGSDTTYTSPTWAAGLYREVWFVFELANTSNIKLTYVGPSGTYSSDVYVTATGAVYQNATIQYLCLVGSSPANVRGRGNFGPLTGLMRFCDFVCAQWDTTATAKMFRSQGTGCCTDSSTDVTGFVLDFGTAPTAGKVYVYGIPA